jgi:hypothetical protein
VKTYSKIFKEDLKYHSVITLTDQIKKDQKDMRKKILDQIDGMKTIGKGHNPFTVNVITYSGHGIALEGDAIGVIPEIETVNNEHVARFINFSG